MLHKAFNPQDTNTLPARCQHRTPNGRQCRTPLTSAHATLCQRHAAALRDDSHDLSALLASELPKKKSAADIHFQLSNLSLLQQGRISPRRAAVLAYISSLLLRTLPAIAKQESGDDEVPIVYANIPRPIRNRPTDAPAQPYTIPDSPPGYPTPNSSADSLSSAPKRYGFRPSTPSVPVLARPAAPLTSVVPAVTIATTLPQPAQFAFPAQIDKLPHPNSKHQSSSSQNIPVPPLPVSLPLPPLTLPTPPQPHAMHLRKAATIRHASFRKPQPHSAPLPLGRSPSRGLPPRAVLF